MFRIVYAGYPKRVLMNVKAIPKEFEGGLRIAEAR
jgi:hypothetical protein